MEHLRLTRKIRFLYKVIKGDRGEENNGLLVYFGVGMYFSKTRCFQIGVLYWCSNIDYIWHLVYIWQVWICLIDSFWFKRAGINCLSCHLYSLTFIRLICWFSSLSWEIEFDQLCWKSAWVFLRVLLRNRLRHLIWRMENESF